MKENTTVRAVCASMNGTAWQLGAVIFCVLYGLALIANNQLSGEATWYWCATLFNHGAKLYSGLHLVYQPLTILETALWIRLFGPRALVTEIPSVFYLLALCVGLFLLLRESDWPDWQKAIVLAASFMLWIAGTSYRFDDYHVSTESYVLYSLILLLQVAKTDALRRQLTQTVALGILCGFTTSTRVNDGAGLLVSTSICLVLLAKTRKVFILSLYATISIATAVVVVLCTGDTLSAYLSSTITNATATKGGSGSLLLAPVHILANAVIELRKGIPVIIVLLAIGVAGILVQRYWKNNLKSVIGVQLGLAAALFGVSPHTRRAQLMLGTLTHYLIPILVLVMYALAVIVVARFGQWRLRPDKQQWAVREVLILIPLAQLASNSLSAAADPRSGYYAHFSIFLLLIPLLQPLRKQIIWANGSLLSVLALVALTQITAKATVPYDWNNTRTNSMFQGRRWYRHPVYGPMYIETNQLQFNQSICAEIGQGGSKPELLSLPFSYPNYFCDTQPWHGYLQTFFDTTRKSTMDALITELQTAPPQWIVYQRQLFSMSVQERNFNHGQPGPQRHLDNLIMQKIANGEWQLVDKNNSQSGDGWFIIRTHH